MKKTKHITKKLTCILLSGFFTFYGVPTNLHAQTTSLQDQHAQDPSAEKSLEDANNDAVNLFARLEAAKNRLSRAGFIGENGVPSREGALSRASIEHGKTERKLFSRERNNVGQSTREEARFMALEDAIQVEGGAFGTMVDPKSITPSALSEMSQTRNADDEIRAEGVLVTGKNEAGKVVAFYFTSNHESNVSITEAAMNMVKSLSSQGYVVSTVHNQPSGTTPSPADYEMASMFVGGKHFIVSNGEAVEFSSGQAVKRGLSSVARSMRAFSFGQQGSDDATLRQIAHDEFQKFLNQVEIAVQTQNTDVLTERFVAEVPQINGVTTTGNSATTLPVVASTTLSGKYNNYKDSATGVKWVYDVRNPEADGSTLKIDRTGETMNLGANFVVHAQAEANTATMTPPVKTRIKFTDSGFNIIEADLLITADKQAFIINFASINAAFDSSKVSKIEFIHTKEVVGTDNRRANILVEVGNLGRNLTAINGQNKSAEPTTLSDLPTATFSGEYINGRSKSTGLVNGFSYVYSIGHSSFASAAATISTAAGKMSASGSFKLWLNAQVADTNPIAVSYPVKATVQFTDKDGKVYAANVNILAEDKEFVFDLAGAGLDFANLKDIKILHGRDLAGANTRVLINVGIKGLASDSSVITGTTITAGAPDSISNLPVASQSGRYLAQIAKTGGVEFRYTTSHDSKDSAVFTLSNPGGTMGVPQSFEFWAKAKPASASPSPAVQFPAKSLVRFTDSNGKQYAVTIALESDLKAFTINLPALSELDFTSLVSIDFIQSQAIDPVNTRANIEIEVGGLFKDTSNLPGSPITQAVSGFIGSPEIKVTGQFGNERSNELGAAYAFDVRHAPSSELRMTIEKEGSTFKLDEVSGFWTFHMEAKELGVALTPPVKTMVRLTDSNGNVIAKIIEVTGDLQQYQIDLNTNFDKDSISKIEFIQSNSLNPTNGRALMNISLVGVGQKENISFTKDIRNNQTIVTTLNALTGDPVRQDIYRDLFDNLAALVGKHPFQTTLFQSDTERLVIDKQNGIPIRYTKQTDIDDDPATVLIATPVDSTGAAIDGETSYTVQKSLGNNETLISSPTNADGTNNAQTTHTLQKTLNADTTLIASPVDAAGLAKADTTYTTQKRLSADKTLISTPTEANGNNNADTRFSVQQTLPDGRVLVASPVNNDGTSNVDTEYSTQKSLPDGSTLVASPVNVNGDVIAGTTIFTKQKTLDKGTTSERTLISVPVESNGDFNTSTRYSTQKTFTDGSVLIAAPVASDGTALTSTVFTKQKTLTDGSTLISTPVNADGSNKADTAHSLQEVLPDGSVLVGTPVNSDGSPKTDTVYSKQKELPTGETLISNPVNSDGSPIAGETGYTLQKALSPTKTLIKTPVDETGAFIPDVTEYSTQETINETTTLIGRPVDVNGDIIFEATEFSLQITLSPTLTLIASPVDETGTVSADTFYTRQEDLGANKTLISTPVNSDGTFKSNSNHSLQERVGAVESLIWTNVDENTKAGTSTTQSIYAQDTDDDLKIDIQDVYDAICSLATIEAGNCSPLSQRIFFLSSSQQIIQQPKDTSDPDSVDQTILAFLDANGNITKQIVYEGGLAVSIADLNNKIANNTLTLSQTIHFIEDAPINAKATVGMEISDISPLPGAVFEASIGVGSSTTFNGRGIDFTFDTTVEGFAGAGFAYNAPFGDLSVLEQLAFGLQRTSGDVKDMFFTVEDSDGDKVSMRIEGLNTNEQIFTFSTADLVRLNPALDLDKIKIMFFEVQGSALVGGFKINRIPSPVQGGNVHANPILDLRDLKSVSSNYTTSDLFWGDATATTLKSSRGINLTYNTGTTAISGGVVGYSPAADFSTLNQLVLGVEGVSGNGTRIKIEFKDSAGNISHIFVEGIINGEENVFAVAMQSLSGSANLSDIKEVLFIVEGAGKSGEMNINFKPTVVNAPRAQLIEDHKNNQTLKATFGADGLTIERQDVYKGIHSTLGALVRAELIQQIITIGNEQLLIDPVNKQTVHGFLNAAGETTQQDVYDGVYYAFADLDPLKLTQRIYFLLDDPIYQLIQTFGTGPNGENQTIKVTLDADGKTIRQDIYNQLAATLGELDIVNLYNTVIFISDTEQLLQVHSQGITLQRIFAAVEPFSLVEEHIYYGIISSTDGQFPAMSTYIVSATSQVVLEFDVADQGFPFGRTTAFTFDTDGDLVKREIYHQIQFDSALQPYDLTGLVLLTTILPIDISRTAIINHASYDYVEDESVPVETTWVEHLLLDASNELVLDADGNPILSRRDIYAGMYVDPALLPADPNQIVFPLPDGKILLKDIDNDQTQVIDFQADQTCVDLYDGVKYDTYNGVVTWDVTVTGLTLISQSCS